MAAERAGGRRASDKPVVVIFLSADPASITRNGVSAAAYLAQAADMAVALARGEQPQFDGDRAISNDIRRRTSPISLSGNVDQPARAASSPAARYSVARGHWCIALRGSRFLQHTGEGQRVVRHPQNQENTIVRHGDDEFPRADRIHDRPVPEDARIPRRGRRPDHRRRAVFDIVVLGYGSADDRPPNCSRSSGRLGPRPEPENRNVAFIGYVCGTDLDPQDRAKSVKPD